MKKNENIFTKCISSIKTAITVFKRLNNYIIYLLKTIKHDKVHKISD